MTIVLHSEDSIAGAKALATVPVPMDGTLIMVQWSVSFATDKAAAPNLAFFGVALSSDPGVLRTSGSSAQLISKVSPYTSFYDPGAGIDPVFPSVTHFSHPIQTKVTAGQSLYLLGDYGNDTLAINVTAILTLVEKTTGPRGPVVSSIRPQSDLPDFPPRPAVSAPGSTYGIDLTKTVGPPEITSNKDLKLLDRHVIKTGAATKCCERAKLQLVTNIIQPYNDTLDALVVTNTAALYALVAPAIGPLRVIEIVPGKESVTLGALRLAGGVVFATIAGYMLAEAAAQTRALQVMTFMSQIIEAAVSRSTQTQSCRKCMEDNSLGQKNPRMRTIWYESKRRRNGEVFARYVAGQRGSVTTRKPGRPKKVPLPLKDPFDKTK